MFLSACCDIITRSNCSYTDHTSGRALCFYHQRNNCPLRSADIELCQRSKFEISLSFHFIPGQWTPIENETPETPKTSQDNPRCHHQNPDKRRQTVPLWSFDSSQWLDWGVQKVGNCQPQFATQEGKKLELSATPCQFEHLQYNRSDTFQAAHFSRNHWKNWWKLYKISWNRSQFKIGVRAQLGVGCYHCQHYHQLVSAVV